MYNLQERTVQKHEVHVEEMHRRLLAQFKKQGLSAEEADIQVQEQLDKLPPPERRVYPSLPMWWFNLFDGIKNRILDNLWLICCEVSLPGRD